MRAAKVEVPLVADIHFLPEAAMEAAMYVDKVRVNPGNFADRKKFQIREYSDTQYEEELERLHNAFSPLVKRCKELGQGDAHRDKPWIAFRPYYESLWRLSPWNGRVRS